MFSLRILGLVLLTGLLTYLGTPVDDGGVGSGFLGMGYGVFAIWVCFRVTFEDAVAKVLTCFRQWIEKRPRVQASKSQDGFDRPATTSF